MPKISVVVRKAYGAGLYAMSGPAFDADATLALPQAMIAVMGAEAAVNAVFANKIAAKPEAERPAYIEQLRQEYREDIDIVKLAANLHVDAIVQGDDLRDRAGPPAGGAGHQDRRWLRPPPPGHAGLARRPPRRTLTLTLPPSAGEGKQSAGTRGAIRLSGRLP